MRVVPLTVAQGSSSDFSTIYGMYFNLLRKGKGSYVVGSYKRLSGCRDTLCDSLVVSYEEPNTGPLYRGAASILVGGVKDTSKIEEVLGFVEEQLKIKKKSRFYKTNKPSYFVARIDPVWVERTYLLSLWALIVRDTHYNFSQAYESPEQFINTYSGGYWAPNYNVRKKYESFVKNGIYMSNLEGGRGTRYLGIHSVVIPGVS